MSSFVFYRFSPVTQSQKDGLFTESFGTPRSHKGILIEENACGRTFALESESRTSCITKLYYKCGQPICIYHETNDNTNLAHNTELRSHQEKLIEKSLRQGGQQDR